MDSRTDKVEEREVEVEDEAEDDLSNNMIISIR
jgi:hypothetical protein